LVLNLAISKRVLSLYDALWVLLRRWGLEEGGLIYWGLRHNCLSDCSEVWRLLLEKASLNFSPCSRPSLALVYRRRSLRGGRIEDSLRMHLVGIVLLLSHAFWRRRRHDKICGLFELIIQDKWAYGSVIFTLKCVDVIRFEICRIAFLQLKEQLFCCFRNRLCRITKAPDYSLNELLHLQIRALDYLYLEGDEGWNDQHRVLPRPLVLIFKSILYDVRDDEF
jgi:hypothetical protein